MFRWTHPESLTSDLHSTTQVGVKTMIIIMITITLAETSHLLFCGENNFLGLVRGSSMGSITGLKHWLGGGLERAKRLSPYK